MSLPVPTDSLPTAAERARTAVACARAAALTTYPRAVPHRPPTCSATVTPEPDGRIVVHLRSDASAAQQLTARPLATVVVAPCECDAVTVHGAVTRLPGRDESGRLRFRVDVGAVRLGRSRPVPVDAYLAATPDPLRDEAPAILEHLRRAHVADLAACLRAHGHHAEWAHARRLDRRGVDVLAVSASGVELVRLAFPVPVTRWADLATGPGAVLLCRCRPRIR